MRAFRRVTVRPVLPAALEPLGNLAGNLRWSWHLETRALFESIDPEVWDTVGGDPNLLLGGVPLSRLAALAQDRRFVRRMQDAADELHEYETGNRWFQRRGATKAGAGDPRAIAYFSPEFGLTAALPQYSGGLGILAGDHLKAASDLGVPVIGVGLLYRNGYFRQSLSAEGWQQERYAVLDPEALPLLLLRDEDGGPAYVRVELPGDRVMAARIWIAQVGRVPLLLLDTDVEENAAGERDITDRLYGGGGEHRLLQELLLGVGGVRAVRTYCRLTGAPAPDVYHTNEGHAGFQGVERIRELVTGENLDFDAALEAVRAGTVFTTHTPVPAGIDRFDTDLITQYVAAGRVFADLPEDRLRALGAEDYPGGDPTVFNMAVMGLRLGQRANGVSALHGVVSRGMFAGLWPGFDASEVPITSITNGVHAPTWAATEAYQLLESVIGPDLDDDGDPDTEVSWAGVATISDAALWDLRTTLRLRLVEDARRRLRDSCLQRGSSEAEMSWVGGALDPDVLTIGFARRVPSYKRLTLMLEDPARLKALLLHPERPIQIVVAGKAHPADDGGKKLIQEIVKFADDPEVRNRILYLPGYEIDMAKTLIPGVDVWLNNPLRPYEACGTSGMKAALNGGLNLSIRDGWWDEWYDGRNGWAIPSAEGAADAARDELEAAALYDLIEGQITPRFYDRDPGGLPKVWLEMVRHSLRSLGPKVLATRMVRDYVERLYAPAAASAHALNTVFDGARGLAAWKHRVRMQWGDVRIDHLETVDAPDQHQLGSDLRVRVFVSLGALAPSDVDVQIITGRVDDDDELSDPRATSLDSYEALEQGSFCYEGSVLLDRTGPFGFTGRILPRHDLLATSAELGLAVTLVAAVPAADLEPPPRARAG